jgi:hypothetical protein
MMMLEATIATLQKEEQEPREKSNTHVDVNIYLIMRLCWNTYVQNMKEN